MTFKRLLPVLLALIILASGAIAQDAPDPGISLEELTTLAAGRDKDQLEKDVGAWKALLKAKEVELATTFKERGKAEGDERDRKTEELEKLREERSALIDRFKAVLSEFGKKGGDVSADDAYVSALPAYLDFKDPNAIWAWLVSWVKSPEGGIKWAKNILAFLAIIFGFKILSGVVAKIMSRGLRASKLDVSDLLRDFFVNTARKLIFFIGLIIALGKIGIDIGPLLAGMGVAGFIIGFALQGTLSNFASGIMILLYRPYDIGDVVSAAGATGKVSEMNLVSTKLDTPDNQTVVIPNSSIWGGVITNITGKPTRRVDLAFGIGYEDDIGKALKILEEIVSGHEQVLADPAPVVQLHELADSSVNFVVRPWCNTSDYWAVYWDITRQVKERFDAAGLSIPFPQQDIHVHGLEQLKGSA